MNIVQEYINNGIIESTYDKIVIDESKLDLFKYNENHYLPFKVDIALPPFSTLKIVCLDVETTGLDPKVDIIKMNGLYSTSGKMICDEGEESLILENLFYILANAKIDVLAVYNGMAFDIPFIIERANYHGIKHPFYKSKYPTTISTAQIFGKPVQYLAYWLNNKHNDHIAIIDLYHQTLSWDFTYRKLISKTLKDVVVTMGLRDADKRLTLSYTELMAEYATGDLSRVREYLQDDLKDTMLLANFLIPAIYYQKMFLPEWRLQKLSTSGGGSKWNTIMLNKYIALGLELYIDSDGKKAFQGGYTEGYAGLFMNFCKIDVASLYPSIMDIYGVCSRKDVEYVQLGILRYLKKERLINKELGKKGDIDAKQLDGCLKIFLNTGYGLLACMGIEFNDYESAALVTAYGRAIVKLMKKAIIDNGGIVGGVDTDGIYYTSDSQDENKLIYAAVCAAMPTGINIEFEMSGKCLFIPPVDDKSTAGLRKNYIIFNYDGTNKAVGRYRKRDKCPLEKDFQINYINLLINKGKDEADKYYRVLIRTIRNGLLDVKHIKIKRKARSNEKDVFARDLVALDGSCSYYIGNDIKVMKTKVKEIYVKINIGAYSAAYYIDMIKNQMKEIERFIVA